MYEAERKNPAIAIALSLLIPGVGSIYADHVLGAVITWGLIIGGFALTLDSVHTTVDPYGNSSANDNSNELTVGVLMMLAGFVYSPIDAYVSTDNYNHALAEQLGLPTSVALVPAPIRTDRGVAWGPGVALRF
jgi:TM2 domain-containing membrane protein YozV